MEHTARGEAAKRAQEGMSVWLQTIANILEGDRKKLVEDLVEAALEEMEFDDAEQREATKEELAGAINELLDANDVEIKQLGGIVGIPAQWFAALFSASVELLNAPQIEEIKERASAYEPGTLWVFVPVIITERTYLVKEVCIDGIWIRKRVKTGEREYTDVRTWRFDNITDNQVPEYIARGVENVKNSGESGRTRKSD